MEKRSFDDPTLLGIAKKHGKWAAQVMLRWHVQEGRSAIPKPVKLQRVAENSEVFDCALTREEVAVIDALEIAVRGGPDPDSLRLEKVGRDLQEAW